MKLVLQFLLAAAFISLSGCGGGGSGGGSAGGVAPTISALSFTPKGVYVNSGGGETTVSGTISFSDPDGDLSTATLNVLDASDQTVVSETINAMGASGMTSGTLRGTVTFSTMIIGDYTVQVFATDSRGARSNQLEGTFRITEFPWIARTPMPTPRLDFAAAQSGGLIYVIGGKDALALGTPKPPVTTVEIYDPSSDTWAASPAMLAAVSEQMAATVNGKIYVIGGRPPFGMGVASNAVQEYDPATQTWTVKTDMPLLKRNAAVAVHNGLIYIAGGASDLLWYDPAMDTWGAGSPMSQSRDGAGGATVDGQIIVYGGYWSTHVPNGGYHTSVESYDPVMDIWSDRAFGRARRDVGVAVLDGLMYAFGGNNFNGSLDWSAAYDNLFDAWTDKEPMSVSINHARAEVVDDKIYVFGTNDTLEYIPSNDVN